MTDKLQGHTQTVWGWYIAAYLFLAGVGAGAYAVAVLAGFGGEAWEPVTRTGVWLAFPLLAIGTVFLILDLGVKPRALRVFLNPGSSWIARGSWIISAFMVLAFLHAVALLQPELGIPVRLLGPVNLALSVLVMIYTGVLLGASRAIGFWNTAMLPALFLVSATSTGVMAVLLLTPYRESLAAPFHVLARADALIIAVELLVIAFYLQSSHRTGESRASAHLLLRGRLAGQFWVGLIAIGLVVPLALEGGATLMADATSATALWMTRGAAVAGLFGGLMLRHLILAAGVRTPLRAAGMEFTFPTPALRQPHG